MQFHSDQQKISSFGGIKTKSRESYTPHKRWAVILPPNVFIHPRPEEIKMTGKGAITEIERSQRPVDDIYRFEKSLGDGCYRGGWG